MKREGCAVPGILGTAAALALGTLTSCAWLQPLWDSPVAPAPETAPGEPAPPASGDVALPGGGSIKVEAPAVETPGPVTVGSPETGTVTINAPPVPKPTTFGDLILNLAGGIAGAVTGNPMIGYGVAAGGAVLAGRLRRKTTPTTAGSAT